MDSNKDTWVDERLAELRPGDGWQPDVSRGLARYHQRREKNRSRKRTWGWLVAGAVAASLPLMAFPTTRAFAQRCVSACVGQSNLVRDLFLGHVSPPAPHVAHVKHEDRRIAPDFVLDDASGKPVKLSDFRGKVVLLNFWATWCPPCRAEIPWFIKFQNTYQDAGFEALGVSMDEDGWGAVKPYIDAQKITYHVMVGNEGVAQLYGATSLPATFIIDKFGCIASTHVGLVISQNEYDADIRAVLNE
jgi:peroxiredoxin